MPTQGTRQKNIIFLKGTPLLSFLISFHSRFSFTSLPRGKCFKIGEENDIAPSRRAYATHTRCMALVGLLIGEGQLASVVDV